MAPHLRASGSIYEFGPEGRAEASFVFPFYHSRGPDGSRKKLSLTGMCMQLLSELVFVYVGSSSYVHMIPLQYSAIHLIGESVAKTNRYYADFLIEPYREVF